MTIPIIGQKDSYLIVHWHTSTVLECHECNNHSIVVLYGANPEKCPHCQTTFTLAIIQWDARTPGATQMGVMVTPPNDKIIIPDGAIPPKES